MKTKVLGLAALLTGTALTLIGIFLGQNAQVLVKAIRVCLECVGIG